MRKLLILGAAIVAVLSLATIAQGQEYDDSHVWFFGNCENQYDSPYYDSSVSGASFLGGACRGIGIFVGDWDNESIAEHVSYEAMDEFGGYWEVDYLKGINLFGGPPAPGFDYGCDAQVPISVTPQTLGGGLWIALFSVVPCEPVGDPQGPLLAVAYIDSNTADGGYNPNLDTLIAKLVDVDSSGTVTNGDAVVTNVYPRDFDASPIGSFTTSVHILNSIAVYEQSSGTMYFGSGGATGGDTFRFDHIPGVRENYEESAGFAAIHDGLGSDDDVIWVQLTSPSAPSDAVDPQISQDDPADTAFIDVEIYFIDTCATDITITC